MVVLSCGLHALHSDVYNRALTAAAAAVFSGIHPKYTVFCGVVYSQKGRVPDLPHSVKPGSPPSYPPGITSTTFHVGNNLVCSCICSCEGRSFRAHHV